jgi:hypothetical protein
MLTRFATTTFFASLLAAGLATGCTVSASTNTDSILTIDNQETFEIDNIFIGPDDGSFVETDDILDGIPLQPGESITVQVVCGTYDIVVTDPTTGAGGCDAGAFDLCASNDEFIIDDAFFNDCLAPRKSMPTPKLSAPTAQR